MLTVTDQSFSGARVARRRDPVDFSLGRSPPRTAHSVVSCCPGREVASRCGNACSSVRIGEQNAEISPTVRYERASALDRREEGGDELPHLGRDMVAVAS